jgi:hypothetical protein
VAAPGVTFSLAEWLRRSTAASKVPPHVSDKRVLFEIAARLKLQNK